MKHKLERAIELEKAKKAKIQEEYSKDKSENEKLIDQSVGQSEKIKGEIDSIESQIKLYHREIPDFSSDYERLIFGSIKILDICKMNYLF